MRFLVLIPAFLLRLFSIEGQNSAFVLIQILVAASICGQLPTFSEEFLRGLNSIAAIIRLSTVNEFPKNAEVREN